MSDINDVLAEAMNAFHGNDAAALRAVLSAHPELKEKINEPIGSFDSPAIIHVRSREILDVLLDAGADINARSQWWAGGFGLLDWAPLDVATYAVERGATLTVHAAARLGLVEALREFLARDPALVHARGGDGQTPLHMASTIEIADLLIAAGADLDARDVDHESTPAQYMVNERQQVARHLAVKGCQTDLLLATALGDLDRVRHHLGVDPACIEMRVDDEWFPKVNPKAGGTIYNWTLGWHESAHGVAKRFARADVLQLLFERTPPVSKMVESCWIEDEPAARRYRADIPEVSSALTDRHRRLIAHAARNNKTNAVRLMLECGLPVDARGQHDGTPLHWAAFHGNADMVREILRFDPPLEATDRDYDGTPIDWVIHGSQNGWYSRTGDYGTVVELLLRAGAKRPAEVGGTAAVRQALGG